jgi:predicted Holliday junction resolvase-like endonuclease
MNKQKDCEIQQLKQELEMAERNLKTQLEKQKVTLKAEAERELQRMEKTTANSGLGHPVKSRIDSLNRALACWKEISDYLRNR